MCQVMYTDGAISNKRFVRSEEKKQPCIYILRKEQQNDNDVVSDGSKIDLFFRWVRMCKK